MKTVDELVRQFGDWLKGNGPSSEIALSSRIRLARNIAGMPFPHRAKPDEKKYVIETVGNAVKKSNMLKNSISVNLQEINEIDRQVLVERHLISHDFTREANGMVVIGDKEIISIMVNEEDHLRMHAISSGMQLPDTFRIIDSIDDELDRNVEYAFSSNYGYLTVCPTNVGTGMRASIMVHLPVLKMTKQIEKVLHATAKLGLAVRGLYGEGSDSVGDFYQISNQVTLGKTEQEIIESIEPIVKKIIDSEKDARNGLIKTGRAVIEDKVYRAYGTVKNARIVNSNEAIELLSAIRLGIDMKMIKDVEIGLLNRLMIMTKPAHLQKTEGKELSPMQRDVRRADILREYLS